MMSPVHHQTWPNAAVSHVECLEARRLLSGAVHSPAPPLDVIGSYVETAPAVLSSGSFHAATADRVALIISSETARGVVAGTLSDDFGKTAAVTGKVDGHRLALRIGTTAGGPADRGNLVARIAGDGALVGHLSESDPHHQPPLHWRDRIALARVLSVPPQPAIILATSYTGHASGSIMFIGDVNYPSPMPFRSSMTLTIESQERDGTVNAEVTGLKYGTFQFAGTLVGGALELSWGPQQILSAVVSADGRVIAGRVGAFLFPENFSAMFTAQSPSAAP